MAKESMTLTVPLELFIDSIAKLSVKEKLYLWRVLDEQLAQVDEEAWEQDPIVGDEIREARAAYEAGDYVTLDEYMSRRKTNKR